jgi:uncharacterized membrane protein
MDSIRFLEPRGLLLLLALLPTLYYARRLRALAPYRRRMIVTLRVVIIILVSLAVAEVEFARERSELGVMYVLDYSDSISAQQRERAMDFIKEANKKMTPDDTSGLVVFGERASLEALPSNPPRVGEITSVPGGQVTNIAEGVRLAMAALPEYSQKRIVVMTDGNENEGQLLKAAEMVRGNGGELNIFILDTKISRDAMADKMTLPSRVQVDEPFQLKVFTKVDRDSDGKLTVKVDGEVLLQEKIKLIADELNPFEIPTNLKTQGFHQIEAIVEVEGDTNPQNNRVQAFTYAGGMPKVLVVDSDPENCMFFAQALLSEKINVELVGPEGLPGSLSQMLDYDAVVLSDIGADMISRDQMTMLQRGTHDLGIGLVMIGGPNSFGAGGYLDTPLEEALPVEMDVTHKKIIPKGALVLVLHAVEIPQGNYWAKEMCKAALSVLSPRDEFGVVIWAWGQSGGGGDQWLIPLQTIEDKTRFYPTITNAPNGDMPQFFPSIDRAYKMLAKSDASIKHCVIISDGDPNASPRLMPAVKSRRTKDRITLSTVYIDGHQSPSNRNIMKRLAVNGGGKAYEVKNPKNLPKIFIKEAMRVTKSLIIEEPFTPKVSNSVEIIAGINGSDFPPLFGYVATSPKEAATVGLVTKKKDPLLAQWLYGLGKSVAFTSDVKSRWSAEWHGWGKFSRFWAQTIRWVMRSSMSSHMQMSTQVDEGVGRVVVDALDDNGNFINFLDLTGRLMLPDNTSVDIPLRQVKPGRYEADFPAHKEGNYLVTVLGKGLPGGVEMTSGGTTVSYSPEYRRTRSNRGLLREAAAKGGGRLIARPEGLFKHNLSARSQPAPLWDILLLIALLLFMLDITVRRVLLSPMEVWQGIVDRLVIAWNYIRRQPAIAQAQTVTGQLLKTKRRVREELTSTKASEAQEFLKRLANAKQKDIAMEQKQTDITPTTTQEEKPDASSYTSKLLEAKRRARKKMK